ncbi:MAG: hypothetical protein ATN33_01130 [Epulopiscium sp. Nele67-Bin001]|nr:MAG: hypothetical protein ATN33_01130 [Epulopiscium sp. Nele67-Bin001]
MTLNSISNSNSMYNLPSMQRSNDDKEALNNRIEESRKKQEETQERMSSGKKVNNAADNAANMAIAQEILAAYSEYDISASNVSDSINRLDVADGVLNSVNENLSRMYELGVQASNSTLTDSDKTIIQQEIDSVKEGLGDLFDSSEFNTVSLFSGEVASMSLESLGVADFDVTGDFDLDTVKSAIENVSTLRSEIGAQTNGLQSQYDVYSNTSYNLKSALSNIEDTDYAQEIMDNAMQTAILKYQMQSQGMMGMLTGASTMNLLA